MAITSNFNPTTGVLTTTGDSHANTITTSRDAAGQIFVNGGAVSINGGPATVANTTEIQVSGGAGNDTISVDETNGRLPAAQLSGGAGNDTITGGSGADRLLGDAGNDVLIGGRGNDELFGGAGNDLFIWNPGDGSDVVEGGTGKDTLQFNGSNANESMDISANGGRVRLTRDVGNVTMDINGVENINVAALGGTDTITVHDLHGTGVGKVNIDLGALGGGSDGQADTVNIDAKPGDTIKITERNGVITVSGLGSDVTISNFDPNNDRIVINGLGSTDVVKTSGLGSDMQLTATGGASVQSTTGAHGNDIGGASTAGDGSHAASLLGQAMASSFVRAGEGHGATPIADPAPSQQPMLAQPHA
jgi:hypothetical protein